MACDGVSTSDFTDILNDFGRTVSYKVVTKTTNGMTGEETSTYGTASDKTVVFFLHENKYIWDKEGLIKVGDAYIIAATSTGIARYDQLTIDSQTYYIDNVTRMTVLGVAMADFGVLFKVA